MPTAPGDGGSSRLWSPGVILCVAGNPSIDKLFEVDRLRPGEIHRPEQFVALPGGKGIHVAQVAVTLGHDAVVIGLLAGHTGRWVAETLAAEGVQGRFVWSAGETRSSLSVADCAAGGLTEFYEDAPPIGAEDWRALAAVVDSLLAHASWIALAGSLPSGAPPGGYGELISAARRAAVPAAIDARGESLVQAISAGPRLVKINVHEAAELLGQRIGGARQALDAAREIRSRIEAQGPAVVITLGEAGMVMIDPEGVAWRGRLAGRGAYPVGSGDAFLAGLLVGLERGESWRQAAALALGAATANAELRGAGRLDPDRARELADAAEVGTPRGGGEGSCPTR